MLALSTSPSGRKAENCQNATPEVSFGDGRLPDRFWSKVRPQSNGCWQWIGAIFKSGYGAFLFDSARAPGKKRGARSAHRGAYVSLIRALPTSLHLDHLCRNRACVNPAHLEPVTPRENILRGVGPAAVAARSSHCPRGHELTPGNTRIVRRGRKTHRACAICFRERHRRANAASRARRSQ